MDTVRYLLELQVLELEVKDVFDILISFAFAEVHLSRKILFNGIFENSVWRGVSMASNLRSVLSGSNSLGISTRFNLFFRE
ncbi:uncharacterized protein PHALS_07542 [Plasmopara halstedii]|uniref:Uncharacterized protein n=1 Tax=Plasmopara halstedii TaxID=4781 RepID=A0A0P1B4W0_PLAHL|nr:uncharacterized protein PHALS_07542 [Plasmopara halstedii]CEG49798.1 hypothetical protein PHALS_07542 [Plasmopara halstedii]|eukprot:XP_024586167.1 hypothetical protein PHALS_07542 [Plasmopara halstedii]